MFLTCVSFHHWPLDRVGSTDDFYLIFNENCTHHPPAYEVRSGEGGRMPSCAILITAEGQTVESKMCRFGENVKIFVSCKEERKNVSGFPRNTL